MKTTLETFCDVFGWQGGTLHQARQRAAVASLKELDRLASRLTADIANISDPRTALEFVQMRTDAHRLHIVGITH